MTVRLKSNGLTEAVAVWEAQLARLARDGVGAAVGDALCVSVGEGATVGVARLVTLLTDEHPATSASARATEKVRMCLSATAMTTG